MPKKRNNNNSSNPQNEPENLSLFDEETINELEVEDEGMESREAKHSENDPSTQQEIDPSPTLEEWSRLYTAAVELRKLAPWTWMYEDELFAVVNPEDGETGYCSIMGTGGEFTAFSVYRGEEGLASYERLRSHSLDDTAGRGPFAGPDVALRQKSLMVSFEGREDVHKRDREVFKSLGLRFRGDQAWPVVRSYEPGCVPWFISARECRFLTYALEQAILVAKRVKQTPELLDSHPGCMLTRVNVAANNSQGLNADHAEKAETWEDKWPVWPNIEKDRYDKIEVPQIDEMRLQRAVRSASASGVWEIDISYAPFSVEEGERPYFPLMMICVDYSSGMVLNVYPADRAAPWSAFVEKLIETIEQHKVYPAKIVVARSNVMQLFESAANIIRAELLMAELLPGVEEVRESMIDFMG